MSGHLKKGCKTRNGHLCIHVTYIQDGKTGQEDRETDGKGRPPRILFIHSDQRISAPKHIVGDVLVFSCESRALLQWLGRWRGEGLEPRDMGVL